MSDRSRDELRKRFNKSPDDDTEDSDSLDESPSADISDTSGTTEIDETGQTDEREQTDETERSQSQSSGDGDGLKERKQVAMYLPADQRSDLRDLYDELDARSTLAGEGGLEKNREFYETVVEVVLDHRHEVADRLDIEIDD